MIWSAGVTETRSPQPAVTSAAAAGAAHHVKYGEEEDARPAVLLLSCRWRGTMRITGRATTRGLGCGCCVAEASVDERDDEHGKERRGDVEPAVPLQRRRRWRKIWSQGRTRTRSPPGCCRSRCWRTI